nr:hypothetical protein [Dehalococcoidales bacterium]
MTSTRLLLVAAALAGLLGLGLSVAPVYAEDPPPEPTPVATPTPAPPEGDPAPDPSGGLLGFLPDPKQWAADVFNQVLVDLLQGISNAIRGVVGSVLGSSLNFITQTPPAGSYASPTVQTLWNVVRAIANGALALVAL